MVSALPFSPSLFAWRFIPLFTVQKGGGKFPGRSGINSALINRDISLLRPSRTLNVRDKKEHLTPSPPSILPSILPSFSWVSLSPLSFTFLTPSVSPEAAGRLSPVPPWLPLKTLVTALAAGLVPGVYVLIYEGEVGFHSCFFFLPPSTDNFQPSWKPWSLSYWRTTLLQPVQGVVAVWLTRHFYLRSCSSSICCHGPPRILTEW